MAVSSETLRIEGERLCSSLMAMAWIGRGVAGGNNPQTQTDADGEARALFGRARSRA